MLIIVYQEYVPNLCTDQNRHFWRRGKTLIFGVLTRLRCAIIYYANNLSRTNFISSSDFSTLRRRLTQQFYLIFFTFFVLLLQDKNLDMTTTTSLESMKAPFPSKPLTVTNTPNLQTLLKCRQHLNHCAKSHPHRTNPLGHLHLALPAELYALETATPYPE